MNPLTHIKTMTLPLLVVVGFGCFGLPLFVQAVSPPPDGGYGGNNTAEGTNALFSLTSGVWNVALGYQALYHDTSGNQNTATGYRALYSNTTGNKSTAYGSQALFSNISGSDNVATGFSTLYSNTTGNRNTGMGYRTLTFNNGDDNTAIGWNALYNNTTASFNTASGAQALFRNVAGEDNTANGWHALFSNASGDENTASGSLALSSNTTGASNTANGYEALVSNVMGVNNTAIGRDALEGNIGGGGNTATGVEALDNNSTGTFNTASGIDALSSNTTGDHNIALGDFAGVNLTTGSYNVDIANQGVPGDGNTIRIGDSSNQFATFIAGIYNVNEGGTILPVYINTDGQLGTQPPSSSRRFKKEIKPMDQVSEAILGLKPVTFQYKSDTAGTPQFGLIAEEVAEVNPDLVIRDANGEIYSVRYDAVNAMLINEFLKEHKKVWALERTVASLVAAVKEQAAQIQKVNAQLQASRPAPQMSFNNP